MQHRKKHLRLEQLEDRVVLSVEASFDANVADDDNLAIHGAGCSCPGCLGCVTESSTPLDDSHFMGDGHNHTMDDFIKFPEGWSGGFYKDSPIEDHDLTPLTVILDFNDPGQANTTDGIGNVVSTFSVTGFGFAESDREFVYNSILAKVQEHYHDITVNLPSGEQLDIEFEIGDIGTPPINGSSDYYYLQIGDQVGGSGFLGQASLNSIRDSAGNPGGAVGSVVGSTFSDAINGLGGLSPSNALTSGNLSATVNAIAGTTSHEVGHALSLLHINKSGTSTPSGLPPIMGTGAIDLPNQDRILERDFSTTGQNAQNGNATQTHVDQLEGALDTHETALPYTLSSAEGDANWYAAATGEIIDDTLEFDAFINSGADVDSYYFAPQRNGVHTISIGDFGNVVDPVLAVFDAASGAKLSLDDDSGPDDDSELQIPLNQWQRYIVAVADRGSNTTGDIEIVIDAPGTGTFGRADITIAGDGTGTAAVTIDDEGDVDGYLFTAPSGATSLSVSTTASSTLDAAIVLFDDATGAQLGRSDGGGLGTTTTLNLSSVSPGDTFLLTVASDRYNSAGTGTITVDFELADSSEPIAFVGTRSDGQVELFKSDGTNTPGTGLLKNVGGSQSSSPHELTVVGSDLYFAATGADGEVELFRTQSNGSTARVKDIAGTTSSDPHELTEYGGLLYFAATGTDLETELWVSDGTNTGTVRVKNLSGSTSSDPADLVVMDGLLYFTATSPTGQRELYVSDGTGPGTNRVRNLYGESVSSDPSDLTVVGSTLYFVATTDTNDRELHKSDGTLAGTVLVKDIGGAVSGLPRNLTEYNGDLVFRARGADGQTELWTSDGTEMGTVQVRDLYGTSVNANPRGFEVYDGLLYFVAVTPSGEAELHVSDGTNGGTGLFVNLSGANSSLPAELTVVDDTLFFSAIGNDGERELYSSDGTANGTGRLKDIAGSTDSSPRNLTAAGTTLYFAATLASGEVELFRSDGTNAGTALVKNLSGSPDPQEIVPFTVSIPADDPSLLGGASGSGQVGGQGSNEGQAPFVPVQAVDLAATKMDSRVIESVFAADDTDEEARSSRRLVIPVR